MFTSADGNIYASLHVSGDRINIFSMCNDIKYADVHITSMRDGVQIKRMEYQQSLYSTDMDIIALFGHATFEIVLAQHSIRMRLHRYLNVREYVCAGMSCRVAAERILKYKKRMGSDGVNARRLRM